MSDFIKWPIREECLECGSEILRSSLDWSLTCRVCGFSWRVGLVWREESGRDEGMMYSRRVEVWKEVEWKYVARGTLGVFGEEGV